MYTSSMLFQITACETDKSLVELFSDTLNYSKLADTGYLKPVRNLTMEDKAEIANTLIDFHCTLKVKAAMDQFLDGVEAVGLRVYLRSHPEIIKPLFTYTEHTLTAGRQKNPDNGFKISLY